MFDHWLRLWNGELSLAEQTVTEDFLVHAAMLDGSAELRGPQALAGWIGQLRAAFPDLTFAVHVGPITEGALSAVRWTATGTYAGGFPGAAAAPGTRIAFTGTDTLRTGPDGRFAEYWLNSDMHVLLAQLGAH
ncbi:ester cyclase [Dactylosporangium sp. CS-047395]|uniref:ester cyclase n=1 Tax=Dactylosporangium sp. CS-047395 TaxID=3239936 RepID=UPI003D8ABB94